MPHTTHPRYATYDVVSVFTGEVVSTHDTRKQANSAKDARSDRHTLRVRGGIPLTREQKLPWLARVLRRTGR